jgi:hypothetical protein
MFCQVCSVFLNSSPSHKTPAWHRYKNDKPAKGGLVYNEEAGQSK